MSLERRPSKSTRRHVRELKARIRQEVGTSAAQRDSYLWEKTEEVLKGMREYDQFAPHTGILAEYFRIRRDAFGNPAKLVEEMATFRQRHDREILDKLKPAFGAITQIVAKRGI